jgi:hypothetical protein
MKVSDLVEPIEMFPGDEYVGIVIKKVTYQDADHPDVSVMWEDGIIGNYNSETLKVLNEVR